MTKWEAVCQIALAAEELSRTDEYIDAQDSNILRDARQLIDETIWANLLQFMRASHSAPQERTGLHMDVPEVPEAGAGVSGA